MAARILVVDDEMHVRRAVAALLKRSGFEVTDVDNAQDGFRMATMGEFDAVVMDLNMPGINGLEGIRSIKLICEDQHIVVLTGYATERTREQALEAGATYCLFKPQGIRELVPTIRKLIGEVEDPA